MAKAAYANDSGPQRLISSSSKILKPMSQSSHDLSNTDSKIKSGLLIFMETLIVSISFIHHRTTSIQSRTFTECT